MVSISLYKIADALQIPLRFDGKAIHGERKGTFKGKGGFTMPLHMIAKAIFYSEQVGVAVHVSGDLYALMAFYPEKGGFSAYLIDAKQLAGPIDTLITPKMKLIEAVEALGKAIVQAFFLKGGVWTPLSMPKR